MTLWHKKNHYPPRWICITHIWSSTLFSRGILIFKGVLTKIQFFCMTHIWSPTLFPRGIIIFQGVLTKFHFSVKFPHLENFVNLMKDLKYEHQSTFPLWGRVKLNFRAGMENQIFFLRTSATVKFFHQIVKK